MTVSPSQQDARVQDIATAQSFLENQVTKFLVKLNRAHLDNPDYIGNLTYQELEGRFIGFLTNGEVK